MLQVYHPKFAYVIHLGTLVFSSLTQTRFSRRTYPVIHSSHRARLLNLWLVAYCRASNSAIAIARISPWLSGRLILEMALHRDRVTPQLQRIGGKHKTDK